MTHHPFRDAEVRVFKRIDADEFIARFKPYDTYPVFWTGTTEAEARERAETFRADAIAKHEADFIARAQAAAKAKETRAKKKEDAL